MTDESASGARSAKRAAIPEIGADGRPVEVRVLTFDDRDHGRVLPMSERQHIVSLGHVRPGDVQVRVGDSRYAGEQDPVDLDALASFPTVRSVVAWRTVRLRCPLPGVEELLSFATPPDVETLRNLPNLRRLHAGRHHSKANHFLDTSVLPVGLERLSVARHILAGGWKKKLPADGPARFADLTRLTQLRELELVDCWPGDSVAPLASLTNLTRLWCDAPNGWSTLRTLSALERVSAVRPSIANLRAFRTWTAVRRLSLGNRGIKSLAGLEAFRQLEDLKLFLLKVADLTPIAGLPRLREIRLMGLTNVNDLAPLGTLPALTHLEITRAGIDFKDTPHVDSLAPLANARALETLTLVDTVVDDADATPLIALPNLRAVVLHGEFGDSIVKLRRARPEIAVTWHEPEAIPGERVGAVYVRPPLEGTTEWWLSEDLTDLLGTRTNHDAERRIVHRLRTENRELLARLDFDTEGSAVNVTAREKDDIIAVAELIGRLAVKK